MRFAVMSDIRGNLVALQSVLSALDADESRLDGIICAGDLVGLGPNPNEVIDLLRERKIESVLGNYDDAIAFDRIGSGRDFPDPRSEAIDHAAVEWTRGALTPKNLEYLQQLPRDIRLTSRAGGMAVKRNEQDERVTEYRRSFLRRAVLGGAFQTPVKTTKRVLIVHGSTRALNEFVRRDTAHSILEVLARDTPYDVLVTGHAQSSFQREHQGITYVGVGPVDGQGRAEFAIVTVQSEVEVHFGDVHFDLGTHREFLRASGLPPELSAPTAHP